ncbi:MAG: tetratricopeptide repeat protein, partial [Gammaproteobacteria bacterium]
TKAWEAVPGAREPGTILTRYYLRNRDTEKALSTARTLYESNPDAPDVLRLLGSAQMAAKENASAVTTFQRMANLMPEQALPRILLATAEAASGDQAAAEKALRDVLKDDPENLQAKSLLAKVLVDANKAQQALKEALDLQKQHPKEAAGFLIEGDVLTREGDHKLAAAAYQAAYDREPSARLAARQHTALQKAGSDGFMDPLLTWLEKNPEDRGVRLMTAMAYSRAGDVKNSITQYETLLESTPNNVIALNNLALMYQKQGDSRALGTAREAYDRAPGQLAIADTYGWMLVQEGDPAAAVPVLEKALLIDENQAVVRYHLAVALAESGDRTRARRELEKLLVRGGDFAEKDDARALLSQLTQ